MVQSGQGIEIPDPTGEYEILWKVNEEEIDLQDIAYELFLNIYTTDNNNSVLAYSFISDSSIHQPISIGPKSPPQHPHGRKGNQLPQTFDGGLSSMVH